MSGITTRTAYGKLQKPNSQDKDLRNESFITGQPVGSNRRALDVFPMGVYEVSASDIVEAGSNDYLVKATAHGAKIGDIFRILTSTNTINEFEVFVDKIVDANFFELSSVLSASLSPGDTFSILRPVANKLSVDGTTLASITNTPIQFSLDGTATNVTEDTVTPANNKPLPVKLVDFSGDISITASQIDVNLEDTEDSVALGDGSGNLIGTVTLPSSSIALSVQDDEALVSLSSIDSKIIPNANLDSGNSTGTPLGANAVYTGDAFNITDYAAINVNVVSDVASATDGLKVQFSGNGTTWVHSHQTTYNGGTGVGYIFNCEWQFARIQYTNGPVAQGSFLLQTIFKTNAVKQSLYTLDQTATGQMFAELGKSVIIGKTTGGGGGYVPVKVNPSGALTADVTGSVSVSNFPATQPVSGSVSVSNFPATQAVSGTFWQATQPVSGTFFQATQPVSAASLPLPSGAATDAKLDSIITAIGSTNTKLDAIELDLSPEFSNFSTQSVFDTPVVTFTAPTAAKRMIIQNSLEASGPIRFVPSANTPSSTSGFYLGVGQSTSEMPAGSFKAIAVNSGEAGDVTVIWFV
jgi:hypothetical protein